MSDTMQKLIELSDHPWIQERWKPTEGDRYYNKRLNGWHVLPEGIYKISGCRYLCYVYKNVVADSSWWELFGGGSNAGNYLWLPLGFNSGTGNWQVDDLLLEAGNAKDIEELSDFFEEWKDKKYNKVKCITFFKDNDLILKLTWLRELLDKHDKEKG